MIYIAVMIINVVVISLLLASLTPKWPEPHDHYYTCDRCWRSYRSATVLSWHRNGQHYELAAENDSNVGPVEKLCDPTIVFIYSEEVEGETRVWWSRDHA